MGGKSLGAVGAQNSFLLIYVPKFIVRVLALIEKVLLVSKLHFCAIRPVSHFEVVLKFAST